MDEISEPNAPLKRMTIGEEFIAWAEQYWALEKKYTESETIDPSKRGRESCPYSLVKSAFSQHIDDLIKHRLFE